MIKKKLIMLLLSVALGILVKDVRTFEYDIPKACSGKTFCWEKGEDYPDAELIEVFLKNSNLIGQGNEDDEYSDRVSFPGDNECKAKRLLDTPLYYVKDIATGIFRAVVQYDDKEQNTYKQLFDIRFCEQEGFMNSSQNLHQTSLKNAGFKLSCSDIYMTFDIDVFSMQDTKIERVQAKLPVCCKCNLIKYW